ncbi:MAG: heavy-metal-associated domain-containing protein [Fimbriimonadaceae bacterium]
MAALVGGPLVLAGCNAEEGVTDEEAALETSAQVAALDEGTEPHDYLITPDDKVELVAEEGQEMTHLTVSNVTCSGCTMTVLKAVMEIDGVKDCPFEGVNTAKGTAEATVVFDPEATNQEEIMAAIAAIEDEEYVATPSEQA